ncbi:MAG: hypothetical protein ACYDGM_13870 [Vulcanimicrobiaceae bacterium]
MEIALAFAGFVALIAAWTLLGSRTAALHLAAERDEALDAA